MMKYTFPVVRAAIEKLGPPREVEKVPARQIGPLLVTLALDISSDCWRDICLRLETMAGGESPPAESLIPDLFEGPPVRSDGAGQILLRTNARWWARFATTAEARFRCLARSTGPLRMLLRSAMVKLAAEATAGNRISHDAALLHVVKNPQEHFSLRFPKVIGLNSLNEATIRKQRSILIRQDAQQQLWIQARSGCCHPSASSYRDDSSHPPSEYAGWRPRNELYYCLAHGLAGWDALFSDSFPAPEWQAWLEEATSNTPPYWCSK